MGVETWGGNGPAGGYHGIIMLRLRHNNPVPDFRDSEFEALDNTAEMIRGYIRSMERRFTSEAK